mmetsp:Transcript_62225/g.181713  ORF Transcript_62225/g.181713 Transcript_62225/m.181713 type:complete len:96 (+) Transcript_62225:715-1002(+)
MAEGMVTGQAGLVLRAPLPRLPRRATAGQSPAAAAAYNDCVWGDCTKCGNSAALQLQRRLHHVLSLSGGDMVCEEKGVVLSACPPWLPNHSTSLL